MPASATTVDKSKPITKAEGDKDAEKVIKK